jgi:hypothetical protein
VRHTQDSNQDSQYRDVRKPLEDIGRIQKMTTYTSTESKKIIEDFLDEFIPDLKAGNLEIGSRHIDEIFPNLPESKDSQIKIALELYSELIRQYKEYSSELMAVLVIGTDYEDTLERHSLQELVDGKLELSPPPNSI